MRTRRRRNISTYEFEKISWKILRKHNPTSIWILAFVAFISEMNYGHEGQKRPKTLSFFRMCFKVWIELIKPPVRYTVQFRLYFWQFVDCLKNLESSYLPVLAFWTLSFTIFLLSFGKKFLSFRGENLVLQDIFEISTRRKGHLFYPQWFDKLFWQTQIWTYVHREYIDSCTEWN